MVMYDGLEVADLRVSGVRLNSYSMNVSLVEGISQLPSRALIGIPAPRRDGTSPVPGRFTEPTQFAITAWISDRNADGSRAADPQVKFEQNWTAFINAFVSQGATIPVERCMPDGTIRIADCRVVASVIPALPVAGATRIAEVKVALDIPDIFWRDKSGPFTQVYTAFNADTALTFLSPSNAPITDGVYRVTGPATNPKIANTYGGYVQYTGTVAAGKEWLCNAKDFKSQIVDPGAGSGTSVLFNTTYYHSAGYLFEIWPSYHVTVTASGTTSASKWSVKADKKFF